LARIGADLTLTRSCGHGVEEAAVGGPRRTRRENVMERQPVTSDMLASVGYDEASATFEVEFVEGGVGLIAADSHGAYFDTNVKNAGYQYARIG
jgi:hypothetical protein